jgi:hypothetical protein
MTPPKDCNFLANIGYPWYVVAHWNEAMGYFVYAELQIDLYQGEWNDTYFTNDNFGEDEESFIGKCHRNESIMVSDMSCSEFEKDNR